MWAGGEGGDRDVLRELHVERPQGEQRRQARLVRGGRPHTVQDLHRRDEGEKQSRRGVRSSQTGAGKRKQHTAMAVRIPILN